MQIRRHMVNKKDPLFFFVVVSAFIEFLEKILEKIYLAGFPTLS
jgi:hypothetical protein